MQRRVISGLLAASIVAFAFLVCCASAPVRAEVMQGRGCCPRHCRMVPVAQPSFFVTPVVYGVARPLSPPVSLLTDPPPTSAADQIARPWAAAPQVTLRI